MGSYSRASDDVRTPWRRCQAEAVDGIGNRSSASHAKGTVRLTRRWRRPPDLNRGWRICRKLTRGFQRVEVKRFFNKSGRFRWAGALSPVPWFSSCCALMVTVWLQCGVWMTARNHPSSRLGATSKHPDLRSQAGRRTRGTGCRYVVRSSRPIGSLVGPHLNDIGAIVNPHLRTTPSDAWTALSRVDRHTLWSNARRHAGIIALSCTSDALSNSPEMCDSFSRRHKWSRDRSADYCVRRAPTPWAGTTDFLGYKGRHD